MNIPTRVSLVLLPILASCLLVPSGGAPHPTSSVFITPTGPLPTLSPKAVDAVYIFEHEPDRPYQIVATAYYDWHDGVITSAEGALVAIRARAASFGADCVMDIERETSLGDFNESTARVKLCIFDGSSGGEKFRDDLVPPGSGWWCFSYESGSLAKEQRPGSEVLDPESFIFGGRCARSAPWCSTLRQELTKEWKNSKGRNRLRRIDAKCTPQPVALCFSGKSVPRDRVDADCFGSTRACTDVRAALLQSGDYRDVSACTPVP